jgi:hypothetical protein
MTILIWLLDEFDRISTKKWLNVVSVTYKTTLHDFAFLLRVTLVHMAHTYTVQKLMCKNSNFGTCFIFKGQENMYTVHNMNRLHKNTVHMQFTCTHNRHMLINGSFKIAYVHVKNYACLWNLDMFIYEKCAGLICTCPHMKCALDISPLRNGPLNLAD